MGVGHVTDQVIARLRTTRRPTSHRSFEDCSSADRNKSQRGGTRIAQRLGMAGGGEARILSGLDTRREASTVEETPDSGVHRGRVPASAQIRLPWAMLIQANSPGSSMRTDGKGPAGWGHLWRGMWVGPPFIVSPTNHQRGLALNEL
jgi:hypothetical protein